MPDIAALLAQLQDLSKKYPNRWSLASASSHLVLHLQIAEAAEQMDPKLAIEHYRNAEECQRTIGTFSTGSGEGLASMMELYDIMVKRAEVEEQLARLSKANHEKLYNMQQVVEIWTEIQADPNLDELLPQKDLKPLISAIQKLEKQG